MYYSRADWLQHVEIGLTVVVAESELVVHTEHCSMQTAKETAAPRVGMQDCIDHPEFSLLLLRLLGLLSLLGLLGRLQQVEARSGARRLLRHRGFDLLCELRGELLRGS